VWIDADHTDGIVAEAISLHMTDFNGGLLKQYQENDARLCTSTARMTFWPEFNKDYVKFFENQVEFDEAGLFKKPDEGLDRRQRAYPDDVRNCLEFGP
jgi:hypothetical protein